MRCTVGAMCCSRGLGLDPARSKFLARGRDKTAGWRVEQNAAPSPSEPTPMLF